MRYPGRHGRGRTQVLLLTTARPSVRRCKRRRRGRTARGQPRAVFDAVMVVAVGRCARRPGVAEVACPRDMVIVDRQRGGGSSGGAELGDDGSGVGDDGVSHVPGIVATAAQGVIGAAEGVLDVAQGGVMGPHASASRAYGLPYSPPTTYTVVHEKRGRHSQLLRPVVISHRAGRTQDLHQGMTTTACSGTTWIVPSSLICTMRQRTVCPSGRSTRMTSPGRQPGSGLSTSIGMRGEPGQVQGVARR